MMVLSQLNDSSSGQHASRLLGNKFLQSWPAKMGSARWRRLWSHGFKKGKEPVKDSFIQVPMEIQHVAVTASWRRVLEGSEVLPSCIWGQELQDIWQKVKVCKKACGCPGGTFWEAVNPTYVLARFQTRRLLDVNQLLSRWFLNAAAGVCVWFGGVVGYSTHSLLSQHTHSHLTHTPDTHIEWN